MKKILVPCDFSLPAINAFRFALDVARQSKGTLQLLHVIEIPVMTHPSLFALGTGLLKDLQEDAERKFEKLLVKYAKEEAKVTYKVEFGVTTAVIGEYTKKNSIDLVVMGSHGASGLREVMIGSNAEKIVRTSAVPVIVIKDYFKGPVKNIVFPNSLEIENQDELVTKVKALQSFFKAHLHLVWINTPALFQNDDVTYERLDDFAKRYQLKDCTLAVFNHINEETGILKYTEMTKGNMIAIGTNGRRGLAHLMMGSKAEDIVNHGKKLIWTSLIKTHRK